MSRGAALSRKEKLCPQQRGDSLGCVLQEGHLHGYSHE